MEHDETGVCVRAGGAHGGGGGCDHDGELHEGRRGVLHDCPSGLGAIHLVTKRNGLQADYVNIPSWEPGPRRCHTVKGKRVDVVSGLRLPLTDWTGWTGMDGQEVVEGDAKGWDDDDG